MSLSCSCDLMDFDEWFEPSTAFRPLETKRSRRCMSCGYKLEVGSIVKKVRHYRGPESDFEERFHGDEVPFAPKWLCRECGEYCDMIVDAGMCFTMGHNSETLGDQIEEYLEEGGCDGDDGSAGHVLSELFRRFAYSREAEGVE